MRGIKFVVLAILLVMLLAVSLFYFKRNEISEAIITRANKEIRGAIAFEDLALNPLVHFPNVSLTLHDLKVYETKNDSTADPIAVLGNVHIAVDVLSLIEEEIVVNALHLGQGEIQMTRYKTGKTNLELAFLPAKKPVTKKKAPTKTPKPKPKKKAPKKKPKVKKRQVELPQNLKLSLSKLTAKAIAFHLEDQILNRETEIEANHITASLIYWGDSIHAKLKTDLTVLALPITPSLTVTDKQIAFQTNLGIDAKDQEIHVFEGEFKVENASFNIFGKVGYDLNSKVDLKLDGYDSDMNVSKLLLTKKGFNSIKKGDVYFDGTIVGDYNQGLPEMEINFGTKSLTVGIPGTDAFVRDWNMDGYFISGTKLDFSEAELTIKNMEAELPNGNVSAKIQVQNFQHPALDYHVNLAASLDGFENIFELGSIKNLRGKVKISDQYQGVFDRETKTWKEKRNAPMECSITNLGFEIPGITKVDTLTFTVSGNKDTLHLPHFKLITGNTDIVASGYFANALSFLIDKELDLQAFLKLKSNVYDLPEFLSFDPRIGRSFPYKIVDVELDLIASTNFQKLTHFKVCPEINFNIPSLDAEIKEFLPPVQLRRGNFVLGEKNDTLHLDFDHFEIDIAGSNSVANYDFYSPRKTPDYMHIDLEGSNINIAKLLFMDLEKNKNNPINSELEGKFLCDITLPRRKRVMMNAFSIEARNLEYQKEEETASFGRLNIDLKEVNYNLSKGSMLSTLTTEGKMAIEETQAAGININRTLLEVKVKNGEFDIVPTESILFGKEGVGQFTFHPFKKEPYFRIQYEVDQFAVEEMLGVVGYDSTFIGNIDLLIDVETEGGDLVALRNNLNGQLLMKGKDVTLLGIELDKFINKFKRSQNFGLVDVGAVALAGPVGLAFSKGGQYALLATNKRGDSTHITQFYSSCDFERGEVKIKDFALATRKYRVATKGWYNIPTDSLEVTFGIVDKKGCSMISQTISGHMDNYEVSKVNIVKALFAPVSNLLDDVNIVECNVFYDGFVEHPKKRKKE